MIYMEENRAFIKQAALTFFDKRPEMYDLYESLESAITESYPSVNIKVQKTQITFSNRRVFACVSFMRPLKKSELPPSYFVLTLGLSYPLDSGRAAVKTEPYPGRWTTHIIISSQEELNDELYGWVRQAYEFAENK